MKILVDELPKTTDECLFYAKQRVFTERRQTSPSYMVYCSMGGHTDCPCIEKCTKLKKGEVHETIDAFVKDKL